MVELFRTKFHIPPLRTGFVSRPRLLEQLNSGASAPLNLVIAPAGFGKTSLVAEWVRSRRPAQLEGCEGEAPSGVVWISLDREDDDPARLAQCITHALQEAYPDLDLPDISDSDVPPSSPEALRHLLTGLANRFSGLDRALLLVLDDYHLIQSPSVHTALEEFIQHLPPQIRVCLIGRWDPPLPLARWRAKGWAAEIRMEDLRFTAEEALEFLSRYSPAGRMPEELKPLAERAEGWVTGLQLISLAMRSRAAGTVRPAQPPTSPIPAQSNITPQAGVSSQDQANPAGILPFIADYLVSEVLDVQPPDVRRFLLHTAVLDRLSAGLCAAVLDPPLLERCMGSLDLEPPPGESGPAQAVLDYLEKANLFLIPLDQERRWYRYHHLFAAVLRQQLERSEPERPAALHRRASEWHEKQGRLPEAIRHALAAADYERAARLIGPAAEELIRRAQVTQIRKWLEALPESLVMRQPDLCLWFAWALKLTYEHGPIEKYLRRVEALLAAVQGRVNGRRDGLAPEDDLPAWQRSILGQVAAIRAAVALSENDHRRAGQLCQEALRLLPESTGFLRSLATTQLGNSRLSDGRLDEAEPLLLAAQAYSSPERHPNIHVANLEALARLRMLQARPGEALAFCERALDLARRYAMDALLPALLIQRGRIAWERNQLEAAREDLVQAFQLLDRSHPPQLKVVAGCRLARLSQARGDHRLARQWLQSAWQAAQQTMHPTVHAQLALWQARFFLQDGNLEAAEQALRHCPRAGKVGLLRAIALRLQARLHLARGKHRQALRILSAEVKRAEAGGRTRDLIECLALQALALESGGRRVEALQALERSLSLAEPGKFIRLYLNEGPPMANLLGCLPLLRLSPALRAFVRQLLSGFSQAGFSQAGFAQTRFVQSGLAQSGNTQPGAPQSGFARSGNTDPVIPQTGLPHKTGYAQLTGVHADPRPAPPSSPLSDRESSVLILIAAGMTNDEIARELYISLNTVRTHTKNIFRKLNVRSRTQAVARARAAGLM